jgi:hypothetical protein
LISTIHDQFFTPFAALESSNPFDSQVPHGVQMVLPQNISVLSPTGSSNMHLASTQSALPEASSPTSAADATCSTLDTPTLISSPLHPTTCSISGETLAVLEASFFPSESPSAKVTCPTSCEPPTRTPRNFYCSSNVSHFGSSTWLFTSSTSYEIKCLSRTLYNCVP